MGPDVNLAEQTMQTGASSLNSRERDRERERDTGREKEEERRKEQ